jgi:predicted nucleic acid-binding protein
VEIAAGARVAEWLVRSGRRKRNAICLDTRVFIYHFESHPRYRSATLSVFESIERGEISTVTSVLSLLEVLTGVRKAGNPALEKQYRWVFRSFPNLQLVPVTEEITDEASSLRAKYGIRTPDAIQIGTALASGSDGFVTNDMTLKRVEEIDVLVLEDLLTKKR